MNEDHDLIMKKTGAKENSCTCAKCQSMCRITPCLGTPSDILRIINNGFVQDVVFTGWAAGLFMGEDLIPMVQARRLENGRCAFLTSDNLCRLHKAGIKPIEGRLASHETHSYSIAHATARTWLYKRNSKTIDLILKAIGKND